MLEGVGRDTEKHAIVGHLAEEEQPANLLVTVLDLSKMEAA